MDSNVVGASKLYEGRTALHAAAENGHIKIVKALLKARADVNIINMCSKLPFTASGVGERTDAVDGEDGNQDRTSLQYAATGKHLEVVKRPLRVEAHVKACVTASGRTALQAAEEGGHVDVVAQLVKAGAKRTARSKGWQLLSVVSAGGA